MATGPWRIAPVLGVRDVKAAMDFYTSQLGFDCPFGAMEPVPGEGAVYAIVHRENTEIHLQIRRREVFASPRERIESDVYVFVGDADALFEEFKAKGVSILRPPEDEPYGLRDFVVEDLEGHRLTFGHPLEGS